MTTLLKIDSSARAEGSYSKSLSDQFTSCWSEMNPAGLVVSRDLSQSTIPQISELTIAGFYAPKGQMSEALIEATRLSDELIEELQASDEIVISMPMYNFSIPASLKAWIDQVVRIGKTFGYGDQGFEGICSVKKAYLLCVYGVSGITKGMPMYPMNFMEPYMVSLLKFIGIDQIETISLEGTSGSSLDPEASALGLKNTIKEAIKR